MIIDAIHFWVEEMHVDGFRLISLPFSHVMRPEDSGESTGIVGHRIDPVLAG
jgi:hypothetical protein